MVWSKLATRRENIYSVNQINVYVWEDENSPTTSLLKRKTNQEAKKAAKVKKFLCVSKIEDFVFNLKLM